ncbi:helicase associated domain-containing protein [Streptomyces sp. NPDC020096]
MALDCLRGGATSADILPGVTVGGEDVGRWLERQRTDWPHLLDGQRERLAELGVTPIEAPARTAPTAEGGARAAAWERGVAAAQQYFEREGTLTGVSRKHVETVVDGDGHEHAVKLGVWLANQRQRRGSLSQDRADALTALGMRWA